MNKNKELSFDYLKTLETIKKQYEEYLTISEIFTLPNFNKEESVQYQTPTQENPLTTNTFK